MHPDLWSLRKWVEIVSPDSHPRRSADAFAHEAIGQIDGKSSYHKQSRLKFASLNRACSAEVDEIGLGGHTSPCIGVGICSDGGVDIEIVCSAHSIHKHFGRKKSVMHIPP